MFPQTDINQITHVITLAIAPVFLLTAVGTIIGVLANRLARIVDRIRVLEDRLHELGLDALAPAKEELDSLRRRLQGLAFAPRLLRAHNSSRSARFRVGPLFSRHFIREGGWGQGWRMPKSPSNW